MSFKVIIILPLIWSICCSVLPPEEPKGIFALKIGLQGDGSLYTLYAFMDNGRSLTHERILTNQEFIKFASGFWPSIYNQKKIDYFKLNNIECGIAKDVNNITNHSYCVPLDSVWKLRYIYFPFSNNPETGWANGSYGPSVKQFEYLKENYDISSFENSYFKGEYLWRLFIDLQNQNWIKNYKSLN